MIHRASPISAALLLIAAMLPAAEPVAPGPGAAGMPAVTTAQPTGAAPAASVGWSEAEAALWRKRVAAAGGVAAQTWITVTGERQRITAEPLKAYSSKTRLREMKHLAPGSLDPASLVIRKNGRTFAVGTDVLLDPVWGGLSLKAGGELTPQDEVELSYRLALRRLDALVKLADGREVVRPGEPELLIPKLPALATGETLLAVIFIDHHANPAALEVLPVRSPAQSPPATTSPERLPAITGKLKQGKPVSVVCWGDSVTEGGDLNTGERYGDVLGKRLQSAVAGSTVTTMAVGGSRSDQWIRTDLPPEQRHARHAETRFQRILDAKADLVIIEFVNDQWMSRKDAEARYRDIISQLRAVGSEVLLLTPQRNWEGPWKPSSFREKDGRHLVAVMRELGREGPPGVGCADMAGRWENLWEEGLPFPALLANGFNHPDARGHRLFYEEVCRAIGISP
jgi:lysophospholipase L1-like esterase